MSDEERDDLRSTSEDVLADSERLSEIERRKIETEPDDPRAVDLADEGERLGRRIADKTRAQKDLTERVSGSDRTDP